ncbi:MAG: VWA domain-containing protein [Treponema sp.]|jgi:Ca-activated chloride channel family protein|nr:VWA domain-containing protein [Treponema sp.]
MRPGFERPLVLAAGVLAVVVVAAGRRFFRGLLSAELPLGPPGGAPFRPPFDISFLIRVFRWMEYAGILLLFTAAAGPGLLGTRVIWLDRGADIFFVVDISPSMAGMDIDGMSRFDAARKLITEFALNRPSDAVGLAAVGNEAGLLLPPTIDRALLLERLDNLRIGELGDGTALGMGLSVAALHSRDSGAERRAVVLITDGENNAGSVHPETAAAALKGLGVSLWVIGVGSSGEVPVDYVDPLLNVRRTGSFESRFDPESLRAIARKGGGTYIAAPSGAAFSAAFDRLDKTELTVRRFAPVTRGKDLSVPVILAALACIFIPRLFRRWYLGALL